MTAPASLQQHDASAQDRADPSRETRAHTPTDRPTVICLTPVKDEAWILDRFLAMAATWADHIIVADQGSTDGSREIARAHPKVHLIENPSATFNEPERQRLLLDAAREVRGPRLLMALDADEALTANWATSPEWQTVLRAQPGTVLQFRQVNVLPGLEVGWIPQWWFPWGYVDDGAPHRGREIHSPRVPMPAHGTRCSLFDIRVLHFAFTDRARYDSRQRWYQMWERLNRPPRRPAAMYRQYHHMDGRLDLIPVRDEWTGGYRRAGIDLTSVPQPGRYRWDADALDLLAHHGAEPFRRLDVWDADWPALAEAWDRPGGAVPADPRSRVDRLTMRYLRRTQGRENALPWRWIDRALAGVGW